MCSGRQPDSDPCLSFFPQCATLHRSVVHCWVPPNSVNSYCTQMLFPGEVGSRLWQGFIYRHLLYHGVIDRPPGIQRNIPDDMAPHKPTDSHSNQHMQITEHMFQPLALCLQECVNGNVVATNPKSTRLQTT